MKRKARRSWKTITSRLSGFSTPVGGVSWTPVADDLQTARELVAQLENRRVLFVDSEAELPEHCVQSVIEIRHILTDFIPRFVNGSEAETACRRMRAACVRFLSEVSDEDIVRNGFDSSHYASWTFLPALGAMRARIGEEIAVVANAFGIDVEEGLAEILPPDFSLSGEGV